MTEFNFKLELERIYSGELLGKTNAGKIYRKLRARDKEFIKLLKEEVNNLKERLEPILDEERIDGLTDYVNYFKVLEELKVMVKKINKLAGDKLI